MIISFNCNAFKIVVLRDVYHWDQPFFGCLGWFGFPVFYWEKLFFVVWLISFFNQLRTCLKWLKPKTVRKVQRSVLLWHLNQISQTWFRLKRFAPIEHALKSIWQALEANFHKWSPATAAIESLQQWYENLAIQSLHSLRGFATLGLFTWLLPITELSFSVIKRLLTIIGNNIQTTLNSIWEFSLTTFHSAIVPIPAMKLTSARTVFLGTSVPHVLMATEGTPRQGWAWRMHRTPSKLARRLMSVKKELAPVILMHSALTLMWVLSYSAVINKAAESFWFLLFSNGA